MVGSSHVVGVVCKQWNLASELKYRCPPKLQSPWLMLPGKSNTTAEFFSIADNKVYQIPCPKPMIRRRICIGSSHGWLITVDESSNMHLMNPLTGAQFPLPPVTTLPFVEAVHDSQGRRRADGTAIDRRPPHTYSLPDAHRVMFHKAILSAAPDEGSGFVVMMICNIWRASAFARAEDKAWTYIDTPDSFTETNSTPLVISARSGHGNPMGFPSSLRLSLSTWKAKSYSGTPCTWWSPWTVA
ncbi:unnamed protein product [Musa acuminata subsp. burmannicoides]